MTINPIFPPYPAYVDAVGKPLEGGFVYIGQPGLEARSSPKPSFFNAAGTIPTGTASGAAVRTRAGYALRNGSAARIYVDGDFSITVTNSAGVMVYSALSGMFLGDAGQVTLMEGNLQSYGASSYPSRAALIAATVNPIANRVDVNGVGAYERSVSTLYPAATSNGGTVKWVPADGNVTPLHFGADPLGVASSSAAFVAAWDYCMEARINNLSVPYGKYLASTQMVMSFPETGMTSTFVMTVNMHGSLIVVPASNTVGGIRIIKHNNLQHLTVKDMRVNSDMPVGTEVSATNGTAFEIYSALRPGTFGFGDSRSSEVYLENVTVGTQSPSLKGRWNIGIHLDGLWYPRLVSCSAITNHPGLKAENFFESGAGIKINNCYSPTLVDCYSAGRWNANISISENTEMQWEDFQLTGCYAVGGLDALVITMQSAARQAATLKEPGGRVSGGHYNGVRHAINVENRRQFTIDGALVYQQTGPTVYRYANAAFIRLDNCHDWIISGNNINEGGHYVSNVNCSRHVYLVGSSDFGSIVGNRFGANGIAVEMAATGSSIHATGNAFTAFPAPNNIGPTVNILDAAGLLRGGDVSVTNLPRITFNGNFVGQTYTRNDSAFVKQGRLVTFWADVSLLTKGSSTGNADIALNLPAPATGSDFAFTVSYSNSASAQAALGGIISSTGALQLYFRNAQGNLNQRVTNTHIDDSTEIRVSGSYISEL